MNLATGNTDHKDMLNDDNDELIVVLASLLPTFVLCFIFIFIFGIICGYCYHAKFKGKKSEDVREIQDYESVLPNELRHQEKSFNLSENVAYSTSRLEIIDAVA